MGTSYALVLYVTYQGDINKDKLINKEVKRPWHIRLWQSRGYKLAYTFRQRPALEKARRRLAESGIKNLRISIK